MLTVENLMFVFELVLAAAAAVVVVVAPGPIVLGLDEVASDAGSFRPGLLLDAPAVEVCCSNILAWSD